MHYIATVHIADSEPDSEPEHAARARSHSHLRATRPQAPKHSGYLYYVSRRVEACATKLIELSPKAESITSLLQASEARLHRS
jgi:hypothetical protein